MRIKEKKGGVRWIPKKGKDQSVEEARGKVKSREHEKGNRRRRATSQAGIVVVEEIKSFPEISKQPQHKIISCSTPALDRYGKKQATTCGTDTELVRAHGGRIGGQKWQNRQEAFPAPWHRAPGNGKKN
jgi:hypothetical protein